MIKQCNGPCQKWKELSDFYKQKSCKFGVTSWCKKCRDTQNKEYIKNHKEEIIEYKKQYYKKNKKEISKMLVIRKFTTNG